MKPFKIRNIEINPPLILSPMAGSFFAVLICYNFQHYGTDND